MKQLPHQYARLMRAGTDTGFDNIIGSCGAGRQGQFETRGRHLPSLKQRDTVIINSGQKENAASSVQAKH